MKKDKLGVLSVLIALFLLMATGYGLADEKELNRITNLPMDELTEEANRILEEKYPNENWEKYGFPEYVYVNESVETGYMIAVKQPGLIETVELESNEPD